MGLNTPSGGGGAPTDAEYVTGSSNSELSNETVVSPAGDILTAATFATTANATPGFDTPTTVSANAAALVTIALDADTDGSTSARIEVQIDETGSGSADYTAGVCVAKPTLPQNTSIHGTVTAFVPAGGQYEIVNVDDPRGANRILNVRHITLTS